MSDIDFAELSHCRCLSARRVSRAFTRIYDLRLRRHGLRATQFSILSALGASGPQTITPLAESLGLERTSLSRAIALLVSKGWVAAGRGSDSRQKPLSLTPAGWSKLAEAVPAWRDAQAFVTGALGQRG